MARQTWKPGNLLNPVPAVMISSGRKGEKPNIMTAAWAGTICSDPVMVSVSIRPERYSYEIIHETGEFVMNLTTRDLAWATDYCGVKSGRDEDKFATAGLTPSPCETVSCPGIAESPLYLECKVTQELNLGSHVMFIAKVTAVSVDEKLMDETGRFDMEAADLIAYSHGQYYTLGENLGKFGYSVRKK